MKGCIIDFPEVNGDKLMSVFLQYQEDHDAPFTEEQVNDFYIDLFSVDMFKRNDGQYGGGVHSDILATLFADMDTHIVVEDFIVFPYLMDYGNQINYFDLDALKKRNQGQRTELVMGEPDYSQVQRLPFRLPKIYVRGFYGAA